MLAAVGATAPFGSIGPGVNRGKETLTSRLIMWEKLFSSSLFKGLPGKGSKTMKWFSRTVSLGLLISGLLVPALATAEGIVDPVTGEVYQRKTVYDFEDDAIDGRVVRPELEEFRARTGAKQDSLIRIRPNFIPEMLRSAEDM